MLKRYGCLFFALSLVLGSAAMATDFHETTLPGDATAFSGAHNFATDTSNANNFDGPALVHCQVGVGCKMTMVKAGEHCKGKPTLVSCKVGQGCTHTCGAEESASTTNANRKAASVQNQQNTTQTQTQH